MIDAKICVQCEFRFHIGSIKSYKALQLYREGDAFRFHTGSIKSNLSRTRHEFQNDCSFDSILVRLKVADHLNPRQLNQFRFHTGSIKRHIYRSTRERYNGFRFHTGSIKSRVPA